MSDKSPIIGSTTLDEAWRRAEAALPTLEPKVPWMIQLMGPWPVRNDEFDLHGHPGHAYAALLLNGMSSSRTGLPSGTGTTAIAALDALSAALLGSQESEGTS